MAEKKAAKGKGISKKLGPLPYWGWAAVGAGTFLVYRYVRARNAATAANAASGLTGGSLIPNDIGLAPTQATPAGNFASVSSWTQAAISFLTSGGMNPADALNAVTSWLNGNCVSQAAYNGLGQAIASTSVGLPPGYSQVPSLSVCSSAPATAGPAAPTPATPPPSLPQLNAQSFPLKVLFGQYSPSDYTQIGTVTNGVYQGKNVTGGAPVYANVFGGFVQDFNMATLPSGTGIYIPSNLSQYEAA